MTRTTKHLSQSLKTSHIVVRRMNDYTARNHAIGLTILPNPHRLAQHRTSLTWPVESIPESLAPRSWGFQSQAAREKPIAEAEDSSGPVIASSPALRSGKSNNAVAPDVG